MLVESKNKLTRILIGLFIIVASLFGLLYFLVTTESGTRWLFHTSFDTVLDISVDEVKGTLSNELTLRQIHYKESDEFSVSIADVKLHWQPSDLLNGSLHISKLYFDNVNIKGQPPTDDEGKTRHKIPNIPLKISIDDLSINQLNWIKGETKTQIFKLNAGAMLEQKKLTLSRLELNMPDLNVKGQSTVLLKSDWPLKADVKWIYLENNTPIEGQVLINGDSNRYELTSQVSGAIESHQRGFVSFSDDQPRFNLQGQWQKLQWPLSGESQASSQQGDFKIQGTTQQYKAQLNASASAINQPDFSIALEGNGNQQGFSIKQLQLKPTQGQLNLNGQVSWDKAVAFNLSLAAKQLDPTDFGMEIPGKLNLNVLSEGKVEGDTIDVALDIRQLTGELHGRLLKGNGKVSFTQQKLDIQQFTLTAGNNHLQAQGWINKNNANLTLKINASDLSTAWPTLTGHLKGDLTVNGSLKKPVINSNLNGNNLAFANNYIGNLSLLVDYNHTSSPYSTLEFTASAIRLAENKIDHIHLQGSGTQGNHNAQLLLTSPLATVNLETKGAWDGKTWLGQVSQLTIDHYQLKKWQLQSPTIWTLSHNEKGLKVDLPISCLTQDKALLCLQAKGSSESKIKGQLLLTDWPLAATKVWLPDELNLTGSISAQAQFSSGINDTTANVNASILKGQATIKDENIIHKMLFKNSTLKLQYQQDTLDAQVHLGLGLQDKVTANIKADKATLKGIRQLSGSIKVNIANMSLLDSLLFDINELQGLLIADLQLGGNTEKPIVIGTAQFQKGQFEIIELGSTLRNIKINVNSTADNPQHLLITGDVESGKGKLSANGRLDLLPEHNYPLRIKITGQNFQLTRLPEAEVAVSPSITIKKYEKMTEIEGLIKIDQAKIELEDVPEQAVSPSKDEVIVTADTSSKTVPKLSQLNTKIAIKFGDNTHFSGFGLTTRLAGKLRYTTKNNKQRIQGQAKMRDATYKAYGQDLKIRKGEFVFTGPADNPWLNIEAIRKAKNDDVTAILAVTGLLKSPKTRVYSEPVLPESEALAYLVTGKSIKGMSQSEGNAVANAALGYGVGQLSWVSEQLGIDEFEFKQSDKIEDSAVKLGEYLNPDLYVGITIGLFSNKYSANLKYNLTDRISIDTRAGGESQRIDIKYHLEMD
ncbi:MAG: translocation/assembly module TamB domain-containing protein [Methylococcaceae bacterium]|nr:translocation/assembly module TamB domain-containing protein [Methylococcaceae bacterium]